MLWKRSFRLEAV